MDEKTQQELVERAKHGEPTAIAELYKRYWRAARAAAYGVTIEINLAEDAASEAFYTALENLNDLKEPLRFGPWLRTIVIRTAERLMKSQTQKFSPVNQNLSETDSSVPENKIEKQELANLIREAVNILSGSLREAISLFYFEGYNIKEAAQFLDVPEGTLKRRLYEGRKQLKVAAEKILKGTKPVNHQREQILKKFEEALNQDVQSEDFFQVMRQVHNLRPVPTELFRKVARKIYADKKEKLEKMSMEKETKIREMMNRLYRHSERANNLSHPAGIAAKAIRAELSGFKSWQVDFSKVDIPQWYKSMFEGSELAYLRLRPPEFSENSQIAYIYPMTAFLLRDDTGIFRTSHELVRNAESLDALKKQFKRDKFLSDVLCLLWKEPQTIELKSIEDLLRRLSKAIVPGAKVQFSAYEEPVYRAALRMQFDENPVPAAIAGVLYPRPEIYGDGHVATAVIYIEPWAEIQSGQTIELSDFSPLLKLLKQESNPTI
jgi:RNA polymerase sigma factor (sigma-70 family)